jgi:Asp-tRNAAsn/Glu-tRNAGln amidotransferase A subunit and related amidases
MLSALELARRIEAGTLRPRAVVELCAEAIAAHENDIGAFAALGIDAARQRAEEPQRACCRCAAFPSV